MKALLLENIHAGAAPILESRGFEVVQRRESLAGTELDRALEGVTLLGIRSNTSVSSESLRRAGDLMAVGCFCIGTNQVDVASAAATGVPVFNAPYANSRSVVELVIGEIIALARRLPEKTERMHAGVWDKSAQGSHEVRGRTLGIVGYGNIGTQLSTVAEALGFRVIFFDTADRPAHGNARRVAHLDELLVESDVVSIHVDGRPGNAGLFGSEQFAMMKPRSLFINASRGMVVDDLALRDHILSGHIAGAALDVFPVEPKAQGDPFESALRGLPNVILTPHIAASTQEAQQEIGQFVAHKLVGFASGGATGLAVNLPQVDVPPASRNHRIAFLHHNAPGVLAHLNSVIAASGDNIVSQSLSTRGDHGYVITDVTEPLPEAAVSTLGSLPQSISVRTWPAA